MATKAFRGLVGSVMILAISACDNVEWDGFSMELLPPPPVAGLTTPAEDSAAAAAELEAQFELPTNPVLYMGTRTDSRVSVHPVGQLLGDSMIPLQPEGGARDGFREAFIERDLSPGTTMTLFAEGVRVGTLRLDSAGLADGWCEPMPMASGIAEVVPAAGTATRFLALAESTAQTTEYGDFQAVDDSFEQRVAGIALANQALVRTGARWPPDVVATRADMQAIPLDGDPQGAIAATFMYEDRLGLGAPDAAGAYSIFVLGQGGPEQYSLDYLWYRPVSEDGKAAPRFFEQFDWDGDGQGEILLEVFGEEVRWEAVLDRGPDGWHTVFESRCPG